MTNATVVSRLRERDRSAWEELYTAHEGRVYGFAFRLTGNPHDAADLTQETFVRVLSRLDRIDVERDLGSYLLTTTKNLFVSSLERGKRSTPVQETPDPDEPAPLEEDPERAALLSRQREEVRAATAELPDRQRLVLALCELEQLSYGQIGEIAGLNENAVAQAIFRARQSLRNRLRLVQVDQSLMPAGCRERLPRLSAHIDGQLKGEQLAETLAHLEQCEHCPAALEDMREASRRYRSLLPPVVLLPGLRERVDSAVTASGLWDGPKAGHAPGVGATRLVSSAARPGPLRTAAMVALVVVALAVLAVLVVTGDGGGDRGGSPQASRTGAVPVTAGGWEKLSRDGLEIAAQPAVTVSNSKVIAAWNYPLRGGTRGSIEAVTFSSSPDDPVSGPSRQQVVTNWQGPGRPTLLSASGGRVRVLFGGLHSTVTADPLNGILIAERRADGSWGKPQRVSNSVYRAGGAIVLADGTPVFGEGVNAVSVRRGLDPERQAAVLGAGYYPAFGVDGSGDLWVAWWDGGDGLLIRRLDADTGAPLGRTYRAPHLDSTDPQFNAHVRLACRQDESGCRVVYRGQGGRYRGHLLSWAPGEGDATVIAAPAAVRDYDAAYRSDGRLWVAWYDRGSINGKLRQGHYLTLGDKRGAGGQINFASQPRRELAGDWDLQIEPLGQGIVLVSSLVYELKAGPAIWVRDVEL
jgi:RNA polymerase sigma factor (sigma-70 family)